MLKSVLLYKDRFKNLEKQKITLSGKMLNEKYIAILLFKFIFPRKIIIL